MHLEKGVQAAINRSTGQAINAWIQSSRLPFLSVGVLPFVLGTLLAWRSGTGSNVPVFVTGLAAVLLIMLATHYNGEYYDVEEDRLSATLEKNRFSGGAQAVAQGLLPRRYARIGAYVAMTLAVIAGLVLQFCFRTGPLTIPLGCVGLASGYYYSKKPLRWVERGIGELLIGFCYGWLPVATAYYLQAGTFTNLIHWMAIPIGCTIFNVILINEYPDYPADLAVKKRNLVVRFGKNVSSVLYAGATLLAWVTFVVSVISGLSGWTVALYLPVFLVTLAISSMLLGRRWQNRKELEIMCGLTIVSNLGTTLVYTLSIMIWGL